MSEITLYLSVGYLIGYACFLTIIDAITEDKQND